MINELSKYWAFFIISFKQAWHNKANLSGILFFLLILIFIYNRLWEVIGLQDNDIHINNRFMWYFLFAEMIILSRPRVERIIFDDIQSGTMAYYLNKPVSFFLMRYTEALGNMSVSYLITGALGTVITLIITGKPPFALWHFPVIFAVCYLSATINTLLYTGVGLCGLWLNNIRTLGMAVERLAFIFGGAIFPLSIYPEWFVKIAKWTPFYSIYYSSIKLVYDFSWYNFLVTIGMNLLWVCLIAGFIIFAYGKLSKKVNIYGG